MMDSAPAHPGGTRQGQSAQADFVPFQRRVHSLRLEPGAAAWYSAFDSIHRSNRHARAASPIASAISA
jgi:hypothetical protein